MKLTPADAQAGAMQTTSIAATAIKTAMLHHLFRLFLLAFIILRPRLQSGFP
jgi:hypothetical protein